MAEVNLTPRDVETVVSQSDTANRDDLETVVSQPNRFNFDALLTGNPGKDARALFEAYPELMEFGPRQLERMVNKRISRSAFSRAQQEMKQ